MSKTTQRSTTVGVVVTGLLLGATLICGSLIGQATLADSLGPQASAALQQANLPASVSFTGREATVTATDQATRDKAKDVVESVYGVRWATATGDSTPSPSPSAPPSQPPSSSAPPSQSSSPPAPPSQPSSPPAPPSQPSSPPAPPSQPVPFGVTIDSASGQLSASGAVANDAGTADLLTQAGRVFGGKVADNLTTDSNVAQPSWWGDLPGVLAKFPTIKGGSLTANDTGIVVTGTVADEAALQQLKNATRDAGFTIDNQVEASEPTEPSEPSVLSAAETAKINKAVVHFASGSYALDSSAKASLKPVVALLKKSTANLEIRGYVSKPHPADRQGPDSKRRAQAVANYLINSGISAKRLTVIGRGTADPVSAQNTPQGRYANQRATLTVKEG